jgi:hypothetical protein
MGSGDHVGGDACRRRKKTVLVQALARHEIMDGIIKSDRTKEQSRKLVLQWKAIRHRGKVRDLQEQRTVNCWSLYQDIF